MKNIYSIILFLFVFLNFNILFAELELTPELKAGKEKVATICSACHGMNGKAESGGNSGAVPNLTAQDKNYLIIKLLDYKSGKLQHPQMTRKLIHFSHILILSGYLGQVCGYLTQESIYHYIINIFGNGLTLTRSLMNNHELL